MPNKVCVPNKTEDLNLCFFNKITGISESKTLARHVSWERKCKFDEENVIHIKSGITILVDASVKNIYVKKIIFGILLHVLAKMENI